MKIEQKALCDFCEEVLEAKRGRCEGNMCVEAEEQYKAMNILLQNVKVGMWMAITKHKRGKYEKENIRKRS